MLHQAYAVHLRKYNYRRSGNFRDLSLRVKVFSLSRIPTNKFLTVLNRIYVPWFGDLEQDYACQENMEYEQFAAFVATSCWQTTCAGKRRTR